MDFMEEKDSNPNSSMVNYSRKKNSIPRPPPIYRLTNGPHSSPSSAWFEIRLFYVRITPCVVENVPEYLKIRHLRHEIGVSLEINGSRVPASDAVSLTLRRDRLDKESSEVTYVSTDSVRITGAIEFEVYEREDLILLCGSLERIESTWSNGEMREKDSNNKSGWCMDCYTSAAVSTGSSVFFQPKFRVSSPSFEVYIAGCCSGSPLVLTKMIQVSPKKKSPRLSTLDAIPEDEETWKERNTVNDLVHHRKLPVTDVESDESDSEGKIIRNYNPEDMYYEEDGQLSWFNAGVRVGVGIGLGMCVGIGIGVGLLMRSYQATTRTVRRRFF